MLTDTRDVLERLARADRQHQKEAAGRLLLQAVKYLCALVLALFAADAVLHLSANWRMGLLAALAVGVVCLFIGAWYCGWQRRNRLEHIARFLESRDPALGSRLINLLQLREQVRDPELAPLTRDLARQAVEGYALELKGTPLERLARTGELRLHARRALIAVLLFAATLGVFFRVTVVELARFVDPYGDHPPYSFTRVEIVSPGPAGTNVVYGKGFVVRANATGHRPKELYLTFFSPGQPGRSNTVPMFEKSGIGFDQLIEPIHTELAVVAHTKGWASFSRQAHIGVIFTPKLEAALLQVSPPAYTRLDPVEKAYAFGNVQALAGSELRFRLRSNRPLREGLLEFGAEQTPARIRMEPSGEREVACTITAKDSGRLRFSLTDIDGYPSQDLWEGSLTVTHDLPPEIRISNPERDSFVAVDFAMTAHIDASDDYGLDQVRVHIGSNGVYATPRVFANSPAPRDHQETVDLPLAEMGFKPGDVLSLYAEAIDTCPDPHLARSQTVRLQVVSVEDYNQFLREETDIAETLAKYEDLMSQLDELISRQKDLGEAAERLKQELASATPENRDKLAMQLDDLLAKQDELNTKLDQHAERMEEFVRKDPVYDVERDLQEILNKLAETIRDSTSTNRASGKEIAEQSSSPSGRQVTPQLADEFKTASDEQVARLEGVQESTDEQIAQTLEDMSTLQELLKDFNEFETLYEVQKELAAQSQAYNRSDPLSREDQLALKELAAAEKEVGDRLDELGQKLLDHSEAAEKLFPKAAAGARDLAAQMADARLSPLARQATSQMLAGKGDRSYRMADRLREEMEKLFAECQECRGNGSGELDNYLRLTRSMNPGKNFSQMARSRRYGSGKGNGIGEGMGEGPSGSSGFATNTRGMDVYGNERRPDRGSATARESSRQGRGTARLAASGSRPDEAQADALKELKPLNRESGAVNAEAGLAEYTDLVDTYFKAITTKKKP